MIWIFLSLAVVFLLLTYDLNSPYSASYDPSLLTSGKSWSGRFYEYLMRLQKDVSERKVIGFFGEVEGDWQYPESPQIWKRQYFTVKDRLQRGIGNALFFVYVLILMEIARRAYGQRFLIGSDPFENPVFLIVCGAGIVLPLYWHTRRVTVDAQTQGFLDGYAQGFQAGESTAVKIRS